MGRLGLRYPPASNIDRDAHAARVALLAEDCADLPAQWLDIAARQWAKSEPFMPRACELRDAARKVGYVLTPPSQTIAAPTPMPEFEPRPDEPPLTDDEIRALPAPLLAMAIKVGEVDADRAAELRNDDPRHQTDGTRYSA